MYDKATALIEHFASAMGSLVTYRDFSSSSESLDSRFKVRTAM